MNYSPLRYPGSKAKLSAYVGKLCVDNNVSQTYIEPYSGGASVALFLLTEGFVQNIIINDKDRAIYAFWYSLINHTEELCNRIEKAVFDIEEWRRHRSIVYNKENENLIDLGYSTFYLNRTNRSGIIHGGVMGGVNQDGKYLMDCRFNKSDLIERIRKIGRLKKNIEVFNLDAIELICLVENKGLDERSLIYFDPPYYNKASSLYMNHYKDEDHKRVAQRISNIKRLKWLVSYDNVPEINNLYIGFNFKKFSFKHTAYEVRKGMEVIYFGTNINFQKVENINPLDYKYDRTSQSIKIRKRRELAFLSR